MLVICRAVASGSQYVFTDNDNEVASLEKKSHR